MYHNLQCTRNTCTEAINTKINILREKMTRSIDVGTAFVVRMTKTEMKVVSVNSHFFTKIWKSVYLLITNLSYHSTQTSRFCVHCREPSLLSKPIYARFCATPVWHRALCLYYALNHLAMHCKINHYKIICKRGYLISIDSSPRGF